MWEVDYKESWVRRIDAFELHVGEDSWESLGLQGDPTLEIKFTIEQAVALSSSAWLCSIYAYVSLFFIWNSLNCLCILSYYLPFFLPLIFITLLSPLFLGVIHSIKRVNLLDSCKISCYPDIFCKNCHSSSRYTSHSYLTEILSGTY